MTGEVLCFDISSGGISAARFDEALRPSFVQELAWGSGAGGERPAILDAGIIESAFAQTAQQASAGNVAAIVIGCFMHNVILLDTGGSPEGPVSTWMHASGEEGVTEIRSRIGEAFHLRTGCRYHPMFPVFKLASTPVPPGDRAGSVKAFLAERLTGAFVEDPGIASASGLLNIHSGEWDPEICAAAGIDPGSLPRLLEACEVVGRVTQTAGPRLGLRAGVPMVNGSGDGFLANAGSGCEKPQRLAVTLGTSAGVRQALAAPVLNEGAGTFCYRAGAGSFLLGCASSNGGNALEWRKRALPADEGGASGGVPLFFPWLNGERSVEWNPDLRAVWYGVSERHTGAELSRAILEGVMFNIAQYAEIVQNASGRPVSEIVLSGNGFLETGAAAVLASLTPVPVLRPSLPGLASLRGAALYAWRALGHEAAPAIERLVQEASPVTPQEDGGLRERFELFKRLRPAAARLQRFGPAPPPGEKAL